MQRLRHSSNPFEFDFKMIFNHEELKEFLIIVFIL